MGIAIGARVMDNHGSNQLVCNYIAEFWSRTDIFYSRKGHWSVSEKKLEAMSVWKISPVARVCQQGQEDVRDDAKTGRVLLLNVDLRNCWMRLFQTNC